MINECLENLSDLKNLLKQLDTLGFTTKLNVFSGGTLGQHTRHIVEFYKSVIFCTDGELFYDKRERNYLLESDLNFCSAQIDALILALSSLKNLDSPVTVYTDFGEFNSSFERELLYVLEHSIHHQALIKIGLMELGLSDLVSPDFGVAPSTKKFRDQCAP